MPPWVDQADVLGGMAKKIKKSRNKNEHKYTFPAPKRGKGRMILKRPAAVKTAAWKNVPYVRNGMETARYRVEQSHWKRNLLQLVNATDKKIVPMLKADGWLHDLSGACCPHCKTGFLGEMAFVKKHNKRQWLYRCGKKGCQQHTVPHHAHPLFSVGNGTSYTSLQEQAGILFCALANVKQSSAHVLLGKNHKLIEGLYARMDAAREKYVKMKEKNIVFGSRYEWNDVEADEVDLGKGENPDASARSAKPIVWEQWGGIVERGVPSSLMLMRLNPASTKRRAPGPGPIRKRDWKPIADKVLKNRNVVLSTDGARTYRLKVPGVLHTWVIHKKKRIYIAGKWKWVRPNYVKLFTHTLPTGKKLKVKGGTQIIDRFWGFLRRHLGQMNRQPGSATLARRIRSAQWAYWNRGEDLWVRSGDMLKFLFSKTQLTR